jgi:hypothetical protein
MRTSTTAVTSTAPRLSMQSLSPPCELCGSCSVFTDEVTSPVPRMESMFLNECKRCHHRWTAAVEAPQIAAQPERTMLPARTAAVRVRPATTVHAPQTPAKIPAIRSAPAAA